MVKRRFNIGFITYATMAELDCPTSSTMPMNRVLFSAVFIV